MKKRLFSILLSLCLILTLLPVTAWAATTSGTCGADGDNLTWTFDNGTLTISGTGNMKDYEYYDDAPWYGQSEAIQMVQIDNNVTSIGVHAFDCCNATNITIPNSVTFIKDQAFARCRELTSVTIPNSVTSIGNSAFYNCSGLTSITIPSSVTSIKQGVFSGCGGLTNVTIPNSVTSIGNSAFNGCSKLTSVTIPNSVTSIGAYAFAGCRGLTSVHIPDSVTSIGDFAFDCCSGLTSVTIPNFVTSIGNHAFSYCSGLTSVTISNSVTSIGNCAFECCWGLTSVRISDSVTSIGNGAFASCRGLTDVYYSGSTDQWKAVTIGTNNDPLINANIHYGETRPEPVIEAPEALRDAFTVSGSGTVTMTIPVGLPAVKNVLCAFDDNVEYQAGAIRENNGKRQVVFEPKEDINYKTAKIFTLDKDYRPVCNPTIVQIPTSD